MIISHSFLRRTMPLFIFYGCIILFFESGCQTSTPSDEPDQHDTIIVRAKELIPEGIAIHPETGTIYLSSLHQRKIVSIDIDGNCKDLITSGQDGFMSGIGIKISGDGKSLWACTASLDTIKSTSALFQIDLSSGKVLRKVFSNSDSASLFNDMAIHTNGDIYFTDTYQGAVFRYDPAAGKLDTWLRSEQIAFANGIVFSDDERILFVASGNTGVQRIDMQTKQVRSVTMDNRIDYSIDGLVYHDKSLIGVIGWPQDEYQHHRVIRYRLSDDNYMVTVDTPAINKPYIHAPTTAAFYNSRLYVLARTNLGLYNRGGQVLESIKDSLEFPLIMKISL